MNELEICKKTLKKLLTRLLRFDTIKKSLEGDEDKWSLKIKQNKRNKQTRILLNNK
ncbi:hypothetical protein SAMN02745248_02782 [Hathewaya proteolytica DSM 3090]|uniref:Uncharacterized protein n=1 Tax=Hathewaya proteolytica DSM 3090 TaxID=1121331 RepID=A0A1M6TBP1_9CLOT|nr:hypothetical protein [Hathewaya proteolytica]SHK54405.1 hypothetical protein SAMN02745248_02782 [Hathewaya proteolytica DSM 3090]